MAGRKGLEWRTSGLKGASIAGSRGWNDLSEARESNAFEEHHMRRPAQARDAAIDARSTSYAVACRLPEHFSTALLPSNVHRSDWNMKVFCARRKRRRVAKFVWLVLGMSGVRITITWGHRTRREN